MTADRSPHDEMDGWKVSVQRRDGLLRRYLWVVRSPHGAGPVSRTNRAGYALIRRVAGIKARIALAGCRRRADRD